MASWRQVAARVFSSNEAGDRLPDLPDFIVTGLDILKKRPCPHRRPVDAWRRATADAIGLAESGWAAAALSLGWHPMELFGCSSDGGGWFSGLAVWLAGDQPVMLDAHCAIARVGEHTARIFQRRADCLTGERQGETVSYLWDLDR